MASQPRNERFLMRQRGAGRALKNADFGLNFGFPTTRMSGRPSRSRSKTPSTQAQQTSRVSQSSLRRDHEASRLRSPPSVSTTSEPAQRSPYDGTLEQTSMSKTSRSAKRRRTVVYSETADDVDERTQPIDGGNGNTELRYSADQDQTQHENDDEKENHTPGGQKPRPRKRKRKSIGQQSLRKKKRTSNEVLKDPALAKTSLDRSASPPYEPRDASVELVSRATGNRDRNIDEDQAVPSASVRSTTKKRKRKSITFTRQKRASSEAIRKRLKENSLESTGVSDADSAIPSVERDNSEDDYVEADDSPDPPTPAPKHKSNGSRRNGIKNYDKEKAVSAKSKVSFPILTQRLINYDLLPTIDELGESDADSEEGRIREAERKRTTDRPIPNTVDVLAQYCRETVEAAVDRLEVAPTANRAEKKRQQTALESVGRELGDRLFEMSAAIEHRIQLESRTRRAKRTKAELQARWLAVRRQREELALRCDHVRQQNWEREREQEAKWTLSEAAHKLEMEVERVESEEEESLEYMLRTVAGDVSDVQGGGGLLDRIKSFNGHLERIAGVLEGRQ